MSKEYNEYLDEWTRTYIAGIKENTFDTPAEAITRFCFIVNQANKVPKLEEEIQDLEHLVSSTKDTIESLEDELRRTIDWVEEKFDAEVDELRTEIEEVK
jgi:predicted RNase H-like nuclease (RuvC/YqgF family)